MLNINKLANHSFRTTTNISHASEGNPLSPRNWCPIMDTAMLKRSRPVPSGVPRISFWGYEFS